MLNLVLADKKLCKIYDIQNEKVAKSRIEKLKTLHPEFISFKEFVEFLHLSKKKKLP